uniref:Uncharacterized protein n=1 Tax=Arundo donax TaxID=35708 RepID=A0A0A9HTN8_ARUDO
MQDCRSVDYRSNEIDPTNWEYVPRSRNIVPRLLGSRSIPHWNNRRREWARMHVERDSWEIVSAQGGRGFVGLAVSVQRYRC